MSENTSANTLIGDPETATLKRCCNLVGTPLKTAKSGIKLVKLKSVPHVGAGLGKAVNVIISETGDIFEVGEPFPVVIPRIYHLNTTV
jgi:hypothetical protein